MQVDLESTIITASPGEAVPCTITVANDGPRDVSATVRVLGVPTDDAGFTTVRLHSGEQTTYTTDILMPLGSPGGTHPFRVEVYTEAGSAATARGEVVIQDAGQVHLALSPSGIRGNNRGELLVSIHNRGKSAVDLVLSGEGDDHKVRFKFGHRKIQVMPGERVNVPTRISSRRPSAGDPVTRRFTVRARGAGIPLSARGTFRQTPVYDRSLSKVMAVVVVLSLWISAVGVGLAVITNRQDILSAIGLGNDDEGDGTGDAGADGAGGDGTADGGDTAGDDAGDAGGDGELAGPAVTDENPAGAPRVTGFVRDADGNGLTGVAVTSSPASLSSRTSSIAVESAIQGFAGKRIGGFAPEVRAPIQAQAVSSGDGTYTVPISTPGSYYLEFRVPGFDTARHLVVFGTDLEPVGLDVTLQRATGSLRGRVVPPGAARILVTDGVLRYETVSDAETGFWEITGVSMPAEFVVSATLPSGESTSTVVNVGAADGNGVDVGALEITSGLTSLSGVVCDGGTAGSEGIPGALVTVTTSADDAEFTTTTADGAVTDAGVDGAGKFVLNGLPIADQYDVTVVAAGFVTITTRFSSPGFQAECIALTGSTGGLVGTVTFDKEGPTTSGISILAVSASNQYSTTVGERGADGAGPFAIDGMSPGEYVVSVTRPDIGTIVRQVQIVPPGVARLDVVVTQVDTDASLSTDVRFVLEGDGQGFKSGTSPTPGKAALPGLTVTVGGIDLDGLLTDSVTDDGKLDATGSLPLGRFRLRVASTGHETVILPFSVIGQGDVTTIDLSNLARSGTDPAIDFDGELRPLASLSTDFVSGLGADGPSPTAIAGTAVLQKVLGDTTDPARGLSEYGPVDADDFSKITMTTQETSFTLDRRIPTGDYLLSVTGDAPDFHWTNEDVTRFADDLKTATSDGTTPVGPDRIVFDRFPLLEIVLDSTAGDDVLDSVTKVIRTIDAVPDAQALCDATPDPATVVDGSVAELASTASLRTVTYDPLPGVASGMITIPDRSIEIDRAAPETATIIACRDVLEPVVSTVNTLAPNVDLSTTLPINPSTDVELYWVDNGVVRDGFDTGMTVIVDGVTLREAGDGLFRTGQLTPGDTFTSPDVSISIPAGTYPGYDRADLVGVTITAGAHNDVELLTKPMALTVPVFAKTGTDFNTINVDLTSLLTPGTSYRAAYDASACVVLGGGVTQCDYSFHTPDTSPFSYGPDPSDPTFGTCVVYQFVCLADIDDVSLEQGVQLRVDSTLPFSTVYSILSGPGVIESNNALRFPDGSLLYGINQVDRFERPLPRGSYRVDVINPSDPDAIFAANGGTLDVTPGKGVVVRSSDALYAITRPTLDIDVLDQAGADLPAGAEAALQLVVEQDGVQQTPTKSTTDPVTVRVNPTDLPDQLVSFDATTPNSDPSGTAEIPLDPDPIVVANPGPIDVSVDLTNDGRFTSLNNPVTVTDTTVTSAVQIDLLRYSTVDIDVRGDLLTGANEDPLLAGALVTLTLVTSAPNDMFSGVIGQYTSAYDADTDTTTWTNLELVNGEVTVPTLELGSTDYNLRLRNLVIPGCPAVSCTATFQFDATHSDFSDTAEDDIVVIQGQTGLTASPLLLTPIPRQVSGTFRTNEGRALVNTAVCVTASPTNPNANPGTSVSATFPSDVGPYGYARGTQSWSLDLVPRTKYTITATLSPCAGGTAGRYTVDNSFTINAKAGEVGGQGTGSGPVTDLDFLFTPTGASVTGSLEALHPDADDGDELPFTGCSGANCPTVTLFLATDLDTALGTATVASDGTFTITDNEGTRVLPSGNETDGFLDQTYVIRVSGQDIVGDDFTIGTLVENQTHDITGTPLIVTLKTYDANLTVMSGPNLEPNIQISLDRTTADNLTKYEPSAADLQCTTGASGASLGKCLGRKLLPGTYSVTGPGGATIISVTGDDDGADLTIDLARPKPGDATTKEIVISLGVDVEVTIIEKRGGTPDTPIVGAPVTFTRGATSLSCNSPTDSQGKCTVSGTSAVEYTITVGSLVIDGPGGNADKFTPNPNTTNATTIEVRRPTMTFDAAPNSVPNGTRIELTSGAGGESCTISAGTCTIQLENSVRSTTVITYAASSNGTASTSTFKWKDSRTVVIPTLVSRDRTVLLRDGSSNNIANMLVFFTPASGGGGAGGSQVSCQTNDSGQCPLTGLYTGDYDITLESGTVSPNSATISIEPTGSTINLTASNPVMTFTGMAAGTQVSLSGGGQSGTCTVAGGETTCSITMSSGAASTNAIQSVTATASLGGTVSTTAFTWRTSRSVAITALTPRIRTVDLDDEQGPPGNAVANMVVTLTPTGGISATGNVMCTTNGSGQCTLSGLHVGNYNIAVGDGATVAPTSTAITTAATGTLDLDASAPTMTFTGLAVGDVITLSGTGSGTCTVSAGTSCTLTLGGAAANDATSSVTATRTNAADTQVSQTTFTWQTSRSVAMPALAPRTRLVHVTQSVGGAAVVGKTVTFTPSSGSAINCLAVTDSSGNCTVSAIPAGNYTVTVSDGTVVTPALGAVTITSAPTGPTIEITYS